MRRLVSLMFPVLLLAGPASADALYSASFSGTATTTIGTTVVPGATVTGSFNYDATTNQFTSFVIGPYSTTGLPMNSATTVPSGTVNPTGAIFRTALSAAQNGGSTNTSFTLDLEAATNFTIGNPLLLLASRNLVSQLDPSSSFEYTTQTGNVAGVDLAASINSLSVQVPEPASLALLGLPIVAMALRRRR